MLCGLLIIAHTRSWRLIDKVWFNFLPFLPDPMAGLAKVTASPKFLCREREQLLHQQTLQPQKAGLSRSADLHPPKMLHDARMAGSVTLRCNFRSDDEGPQWAVFIGSG